MIEHTIQRNILERLTKAETLRFSELKPRGLESNAFMYHLRHLMKFGYVEQQTDKSYRLTPQGLSYVDTLTLINNKPRKQPKVIGIIALRNEQGQHLLVQRLTQPTIGTWMVPSGKRHFGESPEAHAERQVHEWLNEAIKLEHRGFMDVRIHHGTEVISHLSATVYGGTYSGAAPSVTAKFRFQWHDTSAVLKYTPGTQQLLEALETKDEFYISLDARAD